MLKRELKVNWKSFLIWSFMIVFLLGLVFGIYPSININGTGMDELMQMFPKELLTIFHMDLVSLSSVEGWLLSEGYLLITLIGSCYAAYLGSGILLKEENDKTINFILSKPISRKSVVVAKLIAGGFYIFLFNLLIAITTGLGLISCSDFHFSKWLAMSVGPLLLHLFFFNGSVYLSQFFRRTPKSMGVCLGFALGTYFLQVISLLSQKIEFLKYFSPYTYIDAKTIIESSSLSIFSCSILIATMVVIVLFLIKNYEKREFF